MAIIKAREEDVKLLARLIRAEAEGDGKLGMLNVGNVGVNRVLANCLDFEGLRTVPQMVYQSPGGFEAVQRPYFYQAARQQDIQLARQVVRGHRVHPGKYALWFFEPPGACPSRWYNQAHSGRYKSHCFYVPSASECPRVYNF